MWERPFPDMLRIMKIKRPDTHIMTGFKQLLRRFPFTLLMLVVLGATAVFTNTHLSTLTKGWLERLGYAPRDLWLFNWERLFTSALVTFGQTIFWQALGMIALAVGAAEWFTGTKRTAVTFWGISAPLGKGGNVILLSISVVGGALSGRLLLDTISDPLGNGGN